MVYLLEMVIFHDELLNNQRAYLLQKKNMFLLDQWAYLLHIAGFMTMHRV